MKLESPAFGEGERIPARYTCDGEDISPTMTWSGTPPGTRSLVIMCVSPDTPLGKWRHWGVYNIPPQVERLESGCRTISPCPPGATGMDEGMVQQTVNDFGGMGYTGPCRPSADREPHRYQFLLWALDIPRLDLPATATCLQLENEAKPHILEEAVLLGMY